MQKAIQATVIRFLCSLMLLSILTPASAQTWEELGAPPFYKHHSNGFSYNGIGYILEGINNDLSNSMWTYTPNGDTWTAIADFPGPARAIAIGDEWNGKYYYGFGRTNQEYLNDLWVFDPVDSSFTELASCPCTARSHPALIAYQDKIFLGTGTSANGDLRDWWIYDMPTDTWTQKANVPDARRHHPFFFSDGEYVYLGGGHQSTWHKWHIADETWTQINGEPRGRVAGSQFQHAGYGYALGGDNAVHDHVPQDESFMRYDPATDSWEKLPVTPYGLWAPSSFIIDDYVYYFGGINFESGADRLMRRLNLNLLNEVSSVDQLADSELNVFPNPTASGNFTVEFTTSELSDWNIRFFDILGRDLTDLVTEVKNGTYTTSAKGTLFFVANHPDGRLAKRMIMLK